MACVVACLDQLKRTNWSWAWPVDDPHSFMLPAAAFLGTFGRAGIGSGAVGVMQATGRPFGDLEMALLACQRLAVVSDDPSESAKHRRDAGVVLCHLHRYAEAKAELGQYQAWLEHSAEDIEEGEVAAVRDLLLKLTQLSLEQVYTAS